MNGALESFGRLIKIMDELREKCPWDKKQTMNSLRHLTIEEMYELGDAILHEDYTEIKNELGDLLLHIVFYSKIGSEKGKFDVESVINHLIEKLIRRHPHIYGDSQAKTEEEVKANWEAIKLKEGKGKKSVLDGVPKGLPSLVKAIRIQEKVKGVGFDWKEKEPVLDKIQEELDELKKEISKNSMVGIENELGDVLFSIVNYSRFLGVNPEDALEKTNRKFINRFKLMENEIDSDAKEFSDLTIGEMEQYWVKAKKKE